MKCLSRRSVFWRRHLLCIPISFAAAMQVARADEYRLQIGDVVEVTMLGPAGLSKRMTVDADGRIQVPLAGPFDAAGHGIDDLRADITASLAKKSLPAGRDAEGNEVWTVIYPETVVVEIAEFRPIYVTGAVLTPGQKPFSPGLTTRQAVSLAGGYSLLPARVTDPQVQASAAQNYQMYWKRFLRMRARTLRLEAELKGSDKVDFKELGVDPNQQEFVRHLMTVETEILSERTTQIRNEKQSIRQIIAQAEGRLKLLAKKQSILDEEMATYQADLNRVQGLFDKGLMQATRLSEARRDVIFGSSRALETSAEVSRVEKEVVTLSRSLVKVDEDHRIDVLAKLNEAEADSVDAQSQAAIAASQIALPFVGTAAMAQATLIVFRKEGGKDVRLPGDENFLLQPGDVVDVSISPQSELSTQSITPG